MSRNLWSARLLGVKSPAGEATEPGLVFIQIDGLSRTQFERAIKDGRLPFLRKLMERKHFTLETFYSGVPSTTPAVQGELFFGVRAAVPSFQFLRRQAGRDFRMFDAACATEVEDELLAQCPAPLLQGGHAYSNIYRAGAETTRYCSADFAAEALLRRLNPFKLLILGVVYAPKILRMIALAVLEFVVAILDAARGLYDREDVFTEIAFVPARVAICVVLREAIRFRVLLDIEGGVRVIHANFLGYDEQAHRRGPDSAFAHWTLKGIDRAIRDIYQTARDSRYRDYELMVYSDHGQEKATPYSRLHGRELDLALKEVFSKGPLAERDIWIRKMPDLLGNTVDSCRALFGIGRKPAVSEAVPDPPNQIVVTAMGPIGYLYLPEMPDPEEMESYSRDLVHKARIPLVMIRDADGSVRAFNRRGSWRLPEDRAEVLGETHPFLDEATADLIALCGHPDAGEFVISGWNPEDPPLTFPMENGAHGGPGSEETRGFLLLPDRIRRWHLSHLPATRSRVRGEDLRKIVMHYLGRDGVREERVPEMLATAQSAEIRIMTYNIHSCVGIDSKIRPERIARVINHFDPDIVAVQEVDCHRPRSGGHDQAQLIADHLRMTHVFKAMFEEQNERYGIAVFSKYPMEVVKTGFLTEAAKMGWPEARGAIWVKLKMEGDRFFHFVNTHFGLGKGERFLQLQKLAGDEWLGSIPANEPVVLCGDFNTGPKSKIFRMLAGLRDAQQLVEGVKPRATFSSVNPLLRVDHVFVSSHFTVKAVEVPRTSTSVVASDHLPVCVELSIQESDEPAG
ncbi:MAG: endonuclease/exonuclease/phosphatase family protein [Verrucomicrobiota bacterium]